MPTIEEKIHALGWELPPPAKALAVYIPAIQTGNLIFTSGQLPLVNGNLSLTGKLGKDVSIDMAQDLARIATLNALSAIKSVIGDLDRISRIIKVVVFVASIPDFEEQHLVANGASIALEKIFGDKGKHVRSAVGVASLPLDSPIEIEFIVEITS
ncbi:MAG: RidA family protein [Leptospira sp.]|nr:RidA family protein [Leptospira sp.]